MKKALLTMALCLSLFPFSANAQTIDISQLRQVIELFIAIGIISPDKVDAVRFAFGISTSTPPVVSTTTPIFTEPTVSTETPKTPVVLGSVATKVGAVLGTITKETWQGEEKNAIPIIFNDSDNVSVSIACSGVLNGQYNSITLRKSDFPNGYTFYYRNFGQCRYSLISFDANDNTIGGTTDENGKISRTIHGEFELK